ncbi:MAG TPA: hypothetical protein VF390_00300 [Patescibacteria group bacterium]
MKFEAGLEKKGRDEIKAKGGELKGVDAYKDFNNEPVDELLEKRRKEKEELLRRQKEKIKALEELEKKNAAY